MLRHGPGDGECDCEIVSVSAASSRYSWQISPPARLGRCRGPIRRWNPLEQTFKRFKNNPSNPDSLGNDRIRAIHEDGEGRLWIATYGGGLDRFDRRSGRFEHFRHDPANPHSISDDRVRSLHEDPDGALWVGTYGGGLNRFDPATERFTSYSHDAADPHSLAKGRVRALHLDTDGEDRRAALVRATDTARELGIHISGSGASLTEAVALFVGALYVGWRFAAENGDLVRVHFVVGEVESVALFKNGMGYVTSAAKLPSDATVVRFGQLPVPSFGTFWVGYPPDVKVRGLVTSMEEIEESSPIGSITRLLEANVGRRAVLYSSISGQETLL